MEEGQQQQQQQLEEEEGEVLARLPVGFAARHKAEQGVLLVHRTAARRVLLDRDWLKQDYRGFVLELEGEKDHMARALLGRPDMAAEGEEADTYVGLLRTFFAGPGGMNVVDGATCKSMEELVCLMAERHTQLEAPSTRGAALAAVRAELDDYVDILNVTEGMVLPVLYMLAVLDGTLAHLVAQHLQGVYAELLANNQCSPQAAAAVGALVEGTGLARSDALCLLSEPGFAARAAGVVLDSGLELGTEVHAFWEKLQSSWLAGEDGKDVVADCVYTWTPEQLGFVVQLVTSCFDALTGFVEGAREEECCGPYFSTMVLTCAVGYNPLLVNTVYVYATLGLEDALDLLALVAMHEGLGSEVAIWTAAMLARHCDVAILFDSQFGTAVRNGSDIPVLIADHLHCMGVQMAVLNERQVAMQQQLDAQEQQAAAMQQQLDAQEQQAAAMQQQLDAQGQQAVAAQQQLDAQGQQAVAAQQQAVAAQQATEQRLDALQAEVEASREVLLAAAVSLLEQKPITPRRADKLKTAIRIISTSSRTAGLEPIPFGSRVASPEPEEQQPESSAAASSRAAAEPPAAPEGSAAGSSRAAAAAPTAAAAVAALRAASSGGPAASHLAGGAPGSQAERSSQAAGQGQGFGLGRHTALRAGEQVAARTARQVQQAAERQAEQDRATYGNDSGLRERQMDSGRGRSRTAPVASAAYGRAVQRRWL